MKSVLISLKEKIYKRIAIILQEKIYKHIEITVLPFTKHIGDGRMGIFILSNTVQG